MKTLILIAGMLCVMSSCSKSELSSKGIVCDATMNTVTILTDQNDTLSFSTMNANKDSVDNLLLNDTLEVFYMGKYNPGMNATKLIQYPQSALVGNDADKHGCIASAGYVWSEVQKDCIRVFEKGIRTESVTGDGGSAFIVFSPDSAQLELFFSNGQPNEILDRRVLPSGGYAWNVEDDDTKNVRIENGKWTIGQRGKLIYSEKEKI